MPQIKNFTPLLDSLVKRYKNTITPAVWGRVWRYEQMGGGACIASKTRIAEGLGISVRTLIRHTQALIDDGYIVDHTPNVRNQPHRLTTTQKARVEVIIQATDEGVTEGAVDMTESHSDYDRESHEESNKKEPNKEKQKIKDRAAEPPPTKKRTKKRDIRLDHPAMKAYNEIARYWPPFAVRDAVCQVEDADKWRAVISEWIGKGWNPRNITGMLDVYKNGERQNGTRPAPANAFLDALNAQE